MSLKLKEEMNHLLLLDAGIDDDDYDFNIGLETFAKNIKKLIKSWTLSFASWQDIMKEEPIIC